MMTTAGRRVTGELVKGDDGVWRVAAPAGVAVSTEGVDSAYVLEAFRNGWSRPEITAAIVRAGSSIPVATLHRKVDQVLLDAGIREVEEERRRGGRRSGTGEADLPVLLRSLR